MSGRTCFSDIVENTRKVIDDSWQLLARTRGALVLTPTRDRLDAHRAKVAKRTRDAARLARRDPEKP